MEDTIISIDVGGTIFKTKKSTLTKRLRIPSHFKKNDKEFYQPHLLEEIVNNWNGVDPIFIDRDPKYFSYILNFLRNANMNSVLAEINAYTFLKSNARFDYHHLLREIIFFKLQAMLDVTSAVKWP